MSISPINSGVARLSVDDFTSAGDLLAIAEQLCGDASEQLRGLGRNSIAAARNNLALRTRLLDVADLLGALPSSSSDPTVSQLGPDFASSQALLANVQSTGFSLSTSTTYSVLTIYFAPDFLPGDLPTGSTAAHIATAAELATIEAAPLSTTITDSVAEVRETTDSAGNRTVYWLTPVALTAKADDVAALATKLVGEEAKLRAQFDGEIMLRVKAVSVELESSQSDAPDKALKQARKDETRQVDAHASDVARTNDVWDRQQLREQHRREAPQAVESRAPHTNPPANAQASSKPEIQS